MLVLKKLGTVTAGAMVLFGGMAVAAAPASANTCAPVYNPLDPSEHVNVCADAQTYDADPTNAGFGVMAAASASIKLDGYSHWCSGYHGAGANVDFGVAPYVHPDTVNEDPSDCT